MCFQNSKLSSVGVVALIMSDAFIKQDIIECSDDENYGMKQNQVNII